MWTILGMEHSEGNPMAYCLPRASDTVETILTRRERNFVVDYSNRRGSPLSISRAKSANRSTTGVDQPFHGAS